MPRLYNISSWQNYSTKDVKEMWQTYPKARQKRNLRVWEGEVESEICSIIQNLELNSRRDALLWCTNNGNFSTRQCYHKLEGFDNNAEGNWMKIWKLKVPPKIHIFL